MLRWGLLFLGVYLVYLGISQRHGSESLTEDTVFFTLRDARRLCRDGGSRFVRLEADVDLTRRVYPSGLRVPDFTSCRPDDFHVVLDPAATEPSDLDLGADVFKHMLKKDLRPRPCQKRPSAPIAASTATSRGATKRHGRAEIPVSWDRIGRLKKSCTPSISSAVASSK